MNQQGERRDGHEDDWWAELYDEAKPDAGPTAADDSLDERFNEASRTVGSGTGSTASVASEPAGPEPFDLSLDDRWPYGSSADEVARSRTEWPAEPPPSEDFWSNPPSAPAPDSPDSDAPAPDLIPPPAAAPPRHVVPRARAPWEPPPPDQLPRDYDESTSPAQAGFVGDGPPTYDAEPTALPVADPADLGDLVPDTVLDGAHYGTLSLRAVSLRGDSARYRGEPRRDALLTARFGTGDGALLLVAVASGARASEGAHRAAQDACQWIGGAVGRSHARLAEDLRAGRRGALKSGLRRLTERGYGRLRATAADLGLSPTEYTASLCCLLLPADSDCRTRVFFGSGDGGLFRLRDGMWQDLEPEVSGAGRMGGPVLGYGAHPQTLALSGPQPERQRPDPRAEPVQPAQPARSERPRSAPAPYGSTHPEPTRPEFPRAEAPPSGARTGQDDPDPKSESHPEQGPFRFRASIARPGDTLLLCSGGLAEPLRGEPALTERLAGVWSPVEPPGLAAFLADVQLRVKGYADDRTAAAVWEA
ncbi:protein phosphatase 2C domain-containing protein [Streptomyces sp. H27-D2]|uniref:protein phosphatase 2C domain-containing protein n=1 Tax=Streptomyces sp. H27-D2 TaxID=3046304 RepID=UPI002DBF3C70|nr:protein phosphatase 2C domain-containing protein [Streptomyces sp. H27-D2]MEC4019909.1 protein phosphatase 2C domain-containing protein [Streptomyces sp. H27-D2]